MPKHFTKEYLRGYPPEYLESLRQEKAFWAKAILIFGGATCGLAYRSIYHEDAALLTAIAASVFLLTLLMGFGSLRSEIMCVLYFETDVPGEWFTDSESMARNCQFLDEIARTQNALPLSHFGFADDFARQKVIWHEASQGLQTIVTLRETLQANSTAVGESKTMIADLKKMEARLKEADKQGTRFCFLLHGDGINGMEVEQRKGKF